MRIFFLFYSSDYKSCRDFLCRKSQFQPLVAAGFSFSLAFISYFTVAVSGLAKSSAKVALPSSVQRTLSMAIDTRRGSLHGIGGRLLKATAQNDCSSSVLGVAYHGHRSVVTLSLRSAFAVKPRRQRNLALRLPLERFLCRRRYHLGRAQKRLGSEVLTEQW